MPIHEYMQEVIEDKESRRELLKSIIKLEEKGLSEKENCIGYHGTSLEALAFFMRKGYLPGHSNDNIEGVVKSGDLFFLPTTSELDHVFEGDEASIREEGVENYNDDETHEEVVEEVSTYAKHRARDHYIMRKLKFNLADQRRFRMITKAIDFRSFPPEHHWNNIWADELIAETGKTKEELEILFQEAEQRKGIIIGINRNVLNCQNPISAGDSGIDIRMHLKEPFTVDCISGIRPVGEVEKDFFKRLKSKIE